MKENVPDEPNGIAQVHNVRFYTIKPRAISCLAYSKVLKCLALGREDASIELWDINYAPFLDRVIRLPNDSPVESLAWASKRLFSVDLNGKLIEWDLNRLEPRYEQSPTGNALWCLDVNSAETELAVGSEEGHINTLSIENDEITYKRLFNKQKGRVLCCKFDKPGKQLVTGSVGTVSIWNVEKGQRLHTMTMLHKNVIVYALQVLSDNTIIAGDSEGYVTVWNGTNATQLDSYKVLDRNVFALAINEEEDRIVCSGMEPPLLRVLRKTQIKREDVVFERWIKFLQRDVSSYYVKALVVVDDRIFSGGEDGILCMTSSSKAHAYVAKYAPFLQGPCATVAPSANLVLLRYPQSLHLWRLGVPRASERSSPALGDCEELQLQQTPDKLLQLNVAATNFIQAAAISPDNGWICYSTRSELRLNRLQLQPLAVQRVTKDLPAELEAASFIAFAKEKLFLLHSESRELRCFSLKERLVEFLYSVKLSAELKDSISHVELSPCGKYLVVATSQHLIAVWLLRTKQPKHFLNLPRYKAGTTALAMHEKSGRLVVAYADGRLVEYDLKQRRFVSETEEHFVSNSSLQCIKGILLDAQNPNIVIVYNEIFLYVLESYDPDAYALQEPGGKSKRISNSHTSKLKGFRLKMQLNRQHLVQVCRLSANELVTIGVQTKNLLASLPPPFERKKFGES